jgi:hypothetical protein
MKVIFLDIDGVLNVYCESRDKWGCTFHKHLVDNLRYIIKKTGAKIVISSTWRSGFVMDDGSYVDGLTGLKQMWIDRNLPGDIIDITPNSQDVVESGYTEFYDLVDRGHEIKLWLDKNPVENYCIIDDDNDFLTEQRGNFVRTANNSNHPDCIDIGYGLTKICAERVVEILNRV